MQDFIVRSNIARFKALMEQEPDLVKRQVLLELLAAETAKLGSDEVVRFKESSMPIDHFPIEHQFDGDEASSAASGTPDQKSKNDHSIQ